MPFVCRSCPFRTTVLVVAKGAARGLAPTAALSQKAYESMFANAIMRCELTRCPQCGRRSFATFGRELARWCGLTLLAGAATTVFLFVTQRRFRLEDAFAVAIAVAVLELAILVGLALEYRASQRAVTFTEPGGPSPSQ